MQDAMARLEDEFLHVLSSLNLEIEVLVVLTSLSISSDRSNSVSSIDLLAVDEDDPVSYCVGWWSSYRSLWSICEIDLLPVAADLYAIASQMGASGYGRECTQLYVSVCKPPSTPPSAGGMRMLRYRAAAWWKPA
jgi:hypothetical protein